VTVTTPNMLYKGVKSQFLTTAIMASRAPNECESAGIRVTAVEKNVLKNWQNVQSADAGRMCLILEWKRRYWENGAAPIKISCVNRAPSRMTHTM